MNPELRERAEKALQQKIRWNGCSRWWNRLKDWLSKNPRRSCAPQFGAHQESYWIDYAVKLELLLRAAGIRSDLLREFTTPELVELVQEKLPLPVEENLDFYVNPAVLRHSSCTGVAYGTDGGEFWFLWIEHEAGDNQDKLRNFITKTRFNAIMAERRAKL